MGNSTCAVYLALVILCRHTSIVDRRNQLVSSQVILDTSSMCDHIKVLLFSYLFNA